MATTPEPYGLRSNESDYFIQDSGAELARLVEQERAFEQALGGLLPEYTDEKAFAASLHRILDVACGSGGWALTMAHTYPHLEVMGCDIDERMIGYANSQAQVGKLDNASFRVMDARKPLDYPDNYFDLVNARWMTVIGTAAWPGAVREMFRITRPGGLIRLTESEDFSITTSPAFERWTVLMMQALKRAGTCFSPTGRTGGQTIMLHRFLRTAGCQHIEERVFPINWSAGNASHEPMVIDHLAIVKLSQPFIIRFGLATQEELDRLYAQAEVEMRLDDFCALWYLYTIWGQKPAE
ncbi:MAG TPA: methyltransferase domain-containing protein [Ktedonobacteraceae bacterium]|jgi:SAM-dependent methyltransferase|nr:methyltransferase domain-containing protein [Ktedonobacteraceae bacterium]